MVENGKVYVFHPKCALSKCLDVDNGGKSNGTNLLIWNYHRSNNQRFQAKSVGKGYFIFQNLQSGTVIDVTNGEALNGTNIQMWESNNIQIHKNGNDYYLDVEGGGSSDGTNVNLYKGNNTDAQKFLIVKKELYRYRVGVKGLKDVKLLENIDITHAAFLIGDDIFEYGTDNKALVGSGLNYSQNLIDKQIIKNLAHQFNIPEKLSENGYVRRRDCGRDPSFNWDRIGSKLNGVTWTQPDELEKCIIESGMWRNEDYDAFQHNCHDFVSYCLYIVGANAGTMKKMLPVFRPHK